MIKKLINKFKNSLIAKNSLWMITATIIKMILSMIVNMITARYLGVTNYGILNYSLSYINFFAGICTLGLDTIVLKYLVNDKKNQGETLGTCLVLRTVSSIISIIMIMILIYLLKGNDSVIIITTILQSISLIFEAFAAYGLWYQFKLQSKYTAIITFIAYVVMAAYRIILVIFKKNIYYFALSHSISSIIVALLYIILYKKQKQPKLSFSFSKGKELLLQSYHFIISSLMVSIYAQTDKMMIGSMLPDISSVGLYTVSTTIVSLWSFIPSQIINSFKPVILEIKNNNPDKYLVKLKQLYSIIIWLSLAYTLFVFIFGKYIVLILYGKEYIGGLTCLRIAIFSVMFSFIGVIREFWLVCEGKQKYAKWFALFGVIFNVILNIILIPRMGIEGAAVATAITQIITGIISPLFFKETRVCVKHVLCGLLFKFD